MRGERQGSIEPLKKGHTQLASAFAASSGHFLRVCRLISRLDIAPCLVHPAAPAPAACARSWGDAFARCGLPGLPSALEDSQQCRMPVIPMPDIVGDTAAQHWQPRRRHSRRRHLRRHSHRRHSTTAATPAAPCSSSSSSDSIF